MNGIRLGRVPGDTIKKKPLPVWAAVSYWRGPLPLKVKEPWQRLFTVCVCLQSVSSACPVRVTFSEMWRSVMSKYWPTFRTSVSLAAASTR